MLARIAGSADLALDAAWPKASGHQDRIEGGELRNRSIVQSLGINVFNCHPRVVVNARMAQRFVQRLVRIAEFGVFAAHGDTHGVLRVLDLCHQRVPALEVSRACEQLQFHADQFV